jgi:GTP pyrophosphokinase
MEYGANETEAIGALLHDAVEDCGGPARQREIEEIFGKEVGEIVAGCTDTDQTPKPPWRERKEKYIAHLETASPSTRLVSASDKVHNARAILHNLREDGDEIWTRFNGGKEGTLWYYRSLVIGLAQAWRQRVDRRTGPRRDRDRKTGRRRMMGRGL